MNELEEFKESYLDLLQKSKDRIDKKDYTEIAKAMRIPETNPSKWHDSDMKRYAKFAIDQMQESV
jgi:hypothetical protein